MIETPQASSSALVPRTPSALSRRVVVGAVLAPIAWWTLVMTGGGLTGASVEWVVLVAIASAFGAAALATYVPGPGAGRAPVWGCAPCAAAAAASLPLAALMLHLNPLQVSSAGMSALVTGLGLVQRIRDPGSCPTRPAA